MEEQTLSKKEKKALKKEAREQERKTEDQKKQNKKIMNWGIGILVIVLGVWLFGGSGQKYNVDVDFAVDTINEIDNVKGGEGAANILVEYSDFQCPACRAYQSLLESFLEEEGERVQLVYRHFPLKTIHPNAEAAAQAAEAAGMQGKFWEYHDELFAKQNSWSPLSRSKARDFFVDLATDLELDAAQFKSDLKQARYIVDAHYSHGLKIGINSTPTFYLNGVRIQPQSVEQLQELLK